MLDAARPAADAPATKACGSSMPCFMAAVTAACPAASVRFDKFAILMAKPALSAARLAATASSNPADEAD
eukprot:Skav227793  [mRNA]  locus=scaffold948:32084:32293:- [translate_table: standard]